MILFLIKLIVVENRIYVFETRDALAVEFYDCVLVQSLFYCRRPLQPIELSRDDDNTSCKSNGGQLRRFSELQLNNISVSTVLHRWRSSIERAEQYSRFVRDDRGQDGYVYQCVNAASFGKNCEYRLPMGNTFDQALEWQLEMRKDNPEKVQQYGDVVCYERVGCDSGVLCLDWREICDGIQQCMFGVDEDHCDLLEMNICDDEDEYRCMNGMCIPDAFFLDGEFDCLDWSDELQFKEDRTCTMGKVSSDCDDGTCQSNQWSCGDGQCILDRFAFQTGENSAICGSRRDQYFMCETQWVPSSWTMPNGRCHQGGTNETSPIVHRNEEQQCEYLLKCVLSRGGAKHCPCRDGNSCKALLKEGCHQSRIQYPRGAIIVPFMFFFYDLTDIETPLFPTVVLINGTVRCRGSFINVTQEIPFETNLDARRITDNIFCSRTTEISSSDDIESLQDCHHANESTDLCNEWNPCMSTSRVRDGWTNCLINEQDEIDRTETKIEQSCARVRRHRFRCSIEEPTCLSVAVFGNTNDDCRNRFDEQLLGGDRKLLEMYCNDRSTDECSLLRQYIDQSWTSTNTDQLVSTPHIPFRFYCDAFWNLDSREDEDLDECRQWWMCPEDLWRCQTGQCIDGWWTRENEWDCGDASDEHDLLKDTVHFMLNQVSMHGSDAQGYSMPMTCNQTRPFLCPSPRASRERFSCIDLEQIGDNHIDCAGAIDERNTMTHCTSQSSMLGLHFRCLSTNTCIPYCMHCWNNHRCSNRSDDEHWCYRFRPEWDKILPADFQCFNGTVLLNDRCKNGRNCALAEDEYMCAHTSLPKKAVLPYRQGKESRLRSAKHTLRLLRYPANANTTVLNRDSASSTQPREDIPYQRSTSSLVPYWCNRGLGMLMSNGSIVCFCPPPYFGDKCQNQTDRLSVLLSLDLSQSIYQSNSDSATLLKLLVLFLFNNQTLMTHQFHIRPTLETAFNRNNNDKMVAHFRYPQSSTFREHRLRRLGNRSDLINIHPYSIRIEIYATQRLKQPSLIAMWRYPIEFDYLPVFRLAKVLRLTGSSAHPNPCSSSSCHPDHEECHPLINDRLNYVCLCKPNFTGESCSQEDARCLSGYCGSESFCKPNYRSLHRGEDLPLCLCSSDRYGDRCEIEHDGCLSNTCQNNGSCFLASQSGQIICVCTKEYFGSTCQWKRSHLRLSLLDSSSHEGAVIQYFELDATSLHVVLVHQEVGQKLPRLIEFYGHQTTLPEIVVAKLYSFHEDSSPELFLLSSQQNAISVKGSTEISEVNRCPHVRTFANGNPHFSFDILQNDLMCHSI